METATARYSKEGILLRLLERCRIENWDEDDDHAAFLHCRPPCSPTVEQRDEERLRSRSMWDTDSRRYVPSKTDDYTHNCRWNDWVPPSESRRRFEAANAAKACLPAKARVCAHMCASADAHTSGLHATHIVWAAVEENAAGKPTLTLRRGSDLLAEMALQTLCFSFPGEQIVVPNVRSRHLNAAVYLRFETRKSFETFSRMIKLVSFAGAVQP